MLQDDLFREKNEGKAVRKILWKIEKTSQIKVIFKNINGINTWTVGVI